MGHRHMRRCGCLFVQWRYAPRPSIICVSSTSASPISPIYIYGLYLCVLCVFPSIGCAVCVYSCACSCYLLYMNRVCCAFVVHPMISSLVFRVCLCFASGRMSDRVVTVVSVSISMSRVTSNKSRVNPSSALTVVAHEKQLEGERERVHAQASPPQPPAIISLFLLSSLLIGF